MTDKAHLPHPADRLQQVFDAVAQHGPALTKIAAELGMTVGQVAGIKRRHRPQWDLALVEFGAKDYTRVPFEEEVKDRVAFGGERSLHAKSTRLKTVDDLIRHMEVDLDNHDIVEQQVTQNEQVTKDEHGKTTVTPYYRIFVKLRPKVGVPWMDLAETMLESVIRERKPAPVIYTTPKSTNDFWQVLVVADPHFGKYSWRGTTGYPDYDLEIAQQHVSGAGLELLNWGDTAFKPGRRTIAFLGDVFHYDTPHGTTTGGTPLERDGRMPKMVDVGTDTIMGLIEASARTAQTDVLFVRGNHDEALTTFLQKAVRMACQNNPRITVDATHTHRKYLFHQGTLLGFTHGDKAKKVLPSLMPHEAKQYWPEATYYEWHTGHTHAQRAEWQRPIETIDGVLVRVAPAICPPDDWHADNGFVGSLKAMETFFYRPGGGFVGMHLSSPSYGITP